MIGKNSPMRDFHFSSEVAARTINKWQDEADVSTQRLSDETGITVDRLKASKRGEIQDLKIEVIFKCSLATGRGLMGVMEFINDQISASDHDLNKLMSLNKSQYTLAQVSEGNSKTAEKMDFDAYAQHMHAEHKEILERFKSAYSAQFEQLNTQIAQLLDSRVIMQEQYKAQLAKMEEQHKFHDHAMVEAHNKEREVDERHFQLERAGWMKTIEQQDETITRLRKNNMRCVLAVCFEAFLLFLALMILLFR